MNTIIRATDTIKELLAYYVSAILVASMAFSFFEHKALLDSLWWALVTATTIGYGDIYPVTLAGKMIAVVLMHLVTLLIIPLLVARMATNLMVDKNEFTDNEQRELRKLLEEIKEKL